MCGRRITAKEKEDTKLGDEGAYRIGNKRYPIVSLVRDILWHKKSWETYVFKEWIEERPVDLVLFVPNDYTLAFEIAHYVKHITKAPMITFFTDDSFYYKQKTGFIDSLRRKWLLKEGRRIVQESDGIHGPLRPSALRCPAQGRCGGVLQCRRPLDRRQEPVLPVHLPGADPESAGFRHHSQRHSAVRAGEGRPADRQRRNLRRADPVGKRDFAGKGAC